jgi:glycosyltransferase involved in cell wall biosynthesis
MFLSIYTFIRDGLFLDYHVVEMLKHHLLLADEIIVNEGYSSDGTFEVISNIDPKIKIFRSHWGQPKDFNWFTQFKNDARQRCTGDWCLLLDCDEFIPEWEFEGLRKYLQGTTEIMVPVRLINFYGNYRVYKTRPEVVNWPSRKMIIHRNLQDIEVWGDGSNVRLRNSKLDGNHLSQEFNCHHFGYVRDPARLRQKWRNIQSMHSGNRFNWFKIPSFVFSLRPHNWMDPQLLSDLAIYEGPYIRAVRDNPSEFVRDGFTLYQLLKGREKYFLSDTERLR